MANEQDERPPIAPAVRCGPATNEEALVAGDMLFATLHQRHLYFDDYAGGDGAFTLLLVMFLDTARGKLTPVARLIDLSDVPLATTLYILDVLIAAGYVERRRVNDTDCFSLTVAMEETMRRYLTVVAGQARDAGGRLG